MNFLTIIFDALTRVLFDDTDDEYDENETMVNNEDNVEPDDIDIDYHTSNLVDYSVQYKIV